MNFRLTESFQKKASKLCKKNSWLRLDLAKQFNLFQQNQFHPSLKLHKLKGNRSDQYAVWIKGDLRALCIKDKEMYIFFDIINHDEY